MLSGPCFDALGFAEGPTRLPRMHPVKGCVTPITDAFTADLYTER